MCTHPLTGLLDCVWVVRCATGLLSALADDFSRIEIDYWTSGGWVRAHTLNGRNQRNYMAGYTGSAESQNWRIFFSGGGNTGRCQHFNDCVPHVSEVELWIADC